MNLILMLTLEQYETFNNILMYVIMPGMFICIIFAARIILKSEEPIYDGFILIFFPILFLLILHSYAESSIKEAREKRKEIETAQKRVSVKRFKPNDYAIFSFSGDTVMIINEVHESQPKLWTVLYKNNAGNYQKADLPEEKLQKIK